MTYCKVILLAVRFVLAFLTMNEVPIERMAIVLLLRMVTLNGSPPPPRLHTHTYTLSAV